MRYPEQTRVQDPAITWLVAQGRYVETFSDSASTNTDMDSVGVLDGRAAAIEVKVSISPKMAWFRPDGTNSIEAKIARTLSQLVDPIPHWLSAFTTHWNASLPPMIVVLAEFVPEAALRELSAMLSARGSEWHFDWEIWRWTGCRIEVLGAGRAPDREGGVLPRPQIPPLVGSSSRSPKSSMDQLRAKAAAGGHGELFDAAVNAALSRKLRLDRGVTCFGIVRPGGRGKCASVFATGAGEHGLNVSFDREWIGIDEGDVPGVDAPPLGYMNTDRYLGSASEFEGLMDFIVAAGERNRGT